MIRFFLFIAFFVSFFVQYELCSSITVLEGMSGAGKSSTLVSLYPILSQEFTVIPELNPEFTDEFKKMDTQTQALIYLELYHKRLELLNKSSKDFLLDRSYFGFLAYNYAVDKINNTNFYPALLAKVEDLFNIKNDFDKIIIFDVEPQISIKRRTENGMHNFWPWSHLDFLYHFREFYFSELPKLTSSTIQFISTTELTKKVTQEALLSFLNIAWKSPPSAPDCTEEQQLKDFLSANQIGFFHSKVGRSFGYPSIITESEWVYLDDEQRPTVVDNAELELLIQNEQT